MKKQTNIINKVMGIITVAVLVVMFLWLAVSILAPEYMTANEDKILKLVKEGKDIYVFPELIKVDRFFVPKTMLPEIMKVATPGQIFYTDKNKLSYSTITALSYTLAFLIFIIFLLARSGAPSNFNIMGFHHKSKAKIPKVSFDDIAGIDRVKEEITDIIEYLKNPSQYKERGARIPHGILLYGPPGVGKTLIAKAMAHEAGVPFYFASGSEFVELFVGVGAKRMRELFEMARQHAPAIIFIDEIDTIAGTRGTKNTNSEETKTLVQLLTELDGVVESENPIVVIAATNRPDILDPALLRPRRFDKMIFVPMPDKKARKEIINVHLQSKPLDPSLDRFQIIEKLATMTTGFSGADIENLINEANLISIKKKKKYIDWEDIKEAYDKITLGLEPGYVLDEDTKKRVAYHEAGHAINAWAIRKKVDLVSILPRSKALGLVRTKEENDKYLYTYNDLFNEIVMLLGGRAAEEIYFSELSTGAANDLKKATQIAKDMITKYGFDSLIVYESTESAWHKESILSPSTDIETKIEHILKKAYEIAKQNITNNEILYNKLVEALLQKEVIDEEEFERIMSEKNDQEEH